MASYNGDPRAVFRLSELGARAKGRLGAGARRFVERLRASAVRWNELIPEAREFFKREIPGIDSLWERLSAHERHGLVALYLLTQRDPALQEAIVNRMNAFFQRAAVEQEPPEFDAEFAPEPEEEPVFEEEAAEEPPFEESISETEAIRAQVFGAEPMPEEASVVIAQPNLDEEFWPRDEEYDVLYGNDWPNPHEPTPEFERSAEPLLGEYEEGDFEYVEEPYYADAAGVPTPVTPGVPSDDAVRLPPAARLTPEQQIRLQQSQYARQRALEEVVRRNREILAQAQVRLQQLRTERAKQAKQAAEAAAPGEAAVTGAGVVEDFWGMLKANWIWFAGIGIVAMAFLQSRREVD